MGSFSKTIVFLLLCSSIILSGCQSTKTPDSTLTPKPTIKATVTKTMQPSATPNPTATSVPEWWMTEDSLEDVEISLVYPWSGNLANRMEILVDTFNQTNEWGVFVTAYGLGSAQQVFQQSEAGMQNGDGPQIVIATIEELAYWDQNEFLVPFDQFISDSTYGMDQKMIGDFHPLFWGQDVVDGQRLGIPIARDAQFLLYNLTWAKTLGFNKPPASPQQFQNQTCAARDAQLENKDLLVHGTGGWIINRQDYPLISWLRAFGIADFPVTEEPYLFDQIATLDTFLFLRQLADDTCAWSSRNPTPYDYFSNRQVLMYSANINDLMTQENILKANENTDEWTVIPYPGLNNDPVIITYGPSFGIFRSTKAQELASWLFIRWMNEPLQQKQLAKENPNLPVSLTLLDELVKDRNKQWGELVKLLDIAQSGPRTSEWRVARFVLPDAVYQIFQTNLLPEQFPSVIHLLDKTIGELAKLPAATGWK
jgi:multiple sugar transport system substrate-binding protein